MHFLSIISNYCRPFKAGTSYRYASKGKKISDYLRAGSFKFRCRSGSSAACRSPAHTCRYNNYWKRSDCWNTSASCWCNRRQGWYCLYKQLHWSSWNHLLYRFKYRFNRYWRLETSKTQYCKDHPSTWCGPWKSWQYLQKLSFNVRGCKSFSWIHAEITCR